jgi:hypothetical protein
MAYQKIVQRGGLVAFRQDGMWGLMDLGGNVSLAPQRYADVHIYDMNRIWVSENREGGKKGVIAADGAEIVPVKYDVLHVGGSAFVGAGLDGKQGFIDHAGNVLIPFEYDEVYEFENGFAGVRSNSKYGVIDERGDVVIPFEYDDVFYTSPEIFVTRRGREVFFLDKNGQSLLPVSCESYRAFSDGRAWFKTSEARLWGAVGCP